MAKTPPAPPTKPTELTSLPSYLLTRISHRYSQSLHAELKSIGLTTIATRIVAALNIFGSLTINELCVHAIAEQPTMSRALDRLEGDGLVQRTVQDNDNRKRVIQLTPKGARLFDDIWPVMLAANAAMLDGISQEDQDVTMRTLLQILKNIRQNPI